MPRIAVMSDIHGNLEALEAVLRAIDGEGADHLIHLGDMVGYNANPCECIAMSRERKMVSILGNHDLAAIDLQTADSLNMIAHEAIRFVRRQLGAEHLKHLRGLSRVEVFWDKYLLCHGAPENIEAYIVNMFQAKRVFNLLRKCYAGIRVCFFGHTHVQRLWMCDERGKVSSPPNLSNGIPLSPQRAYLINPGSVGQPRQGNNRAHYLLFDSDEEIVRFRAVPYDIGRAQEKILQARLPAYLAERLSDGI
ncbi:MAG: metallophosphoesterase [Syntrophobacteraceae bacterium]